MKSLRKYFDDIKWGIGIAFFINTIFGITLLIFDFELKTNSSFPTLWIIYFIITNGIIIYHVNMNNAEKKKRQVAEGLLFREREYTERLESDRRLQIVENAEKIKALVLNIKELEQYFNDMTLEISDPENREESFNNLKLKLDVANKNAMEYLGKNIEQPEIKVDIRLTDQDKEDWATKATGKFRIVPTFDFNLSEETKASAIGDVVDNANKLRILEYLEKQERESNGTTRRN